MSELADNKCDVCGARRSEDINHWVTVLVDADGIQFIPGIIEGEAHLCGAACAVKRLSSWAHDLVMNAAAH